MTLWLGKSAQVQTVSYYLLTEDTMPGASPTVRNRQLGMELRRLREQAGKTQQDAAEWLGIADTGISKIENGKQRISIGQLRSLLQLYDVGSPHSDYLLQLCREAGQRGWWVEYGKTVPKWFRDYVGMETAATEVWTWQPLFIPGLLQVPEYTKAVADSPAEEIERIVRIRSERQKRLTGDDPLILRAIIDEAALRRDVGGPDVMRAQLVRLTELAKLPNVSIQLVPFSAGAHQGMRGAFTALRFPETAMDTVYLEAYKTAAYAEAPAEVAFYTDTFEDLAAMALNCDDTVRLIHSMISGST